LTEDLFFSERLLPASPKQMKVLSIGVDHAMRFNELWHSRLPITQKGNLTRNKHFMFYGSEFKNHCFAVAIWTTPVANNRLSKNETWLELRRLAIPPDAPKFTATWMISKMIKIIKKKHPEITKLISYQDTDVHTGTIYAASNWKKEGLSIGVDWNVSRNRKPSQSTATKARWTYQMQ
jgi:hypothetical protein